MNYGATWSAKIGQYPDTDLHLELIEAAGAYREQNGSEEASTTLINALTQFMGKVDIFHPIIEVWVEVRKSGLMHDAKPNGHEQAGKRGIHVPPSYVSRERNGWVERSSLVLSEDLHWGIVWMPDSSRGPSLRGLSQEEIRKLLLEHYSYEPTSPEEISSLRFNAGGDLWGITNSLLRQVVITRDAAEKRYQHLFGMAQTLIMAEQIGHLPEKE